MGKFDDPQIEIVAFFHELGHIASDIGKRKCFLSKLSQEAMAWEVGLTIAAKYGFEWDDKSEALQWARRQIATYINVSIR